MGDCHGIFFTDFFSHSPPTVFLIKSQHKNNIPFLQVKILLLESPSTIYIQIFNHKINYRFVVFKSMRMMSAAGF